MNNSGLRGLFTSQACLRCEASAHEAVVLHRECAATKQTSLRGAARRGNPISIMVGV